MAKSRWFKRRAFGYGWTPASWQGWSVVVGVIAVIIAAAIAFLGNPTLQNVIIFCLVSITALAVLVRISAIKGPAPRWKWGNKRK